MTEFERERAARNEVDEDAEWCAGLIRALLTTPLEPSRGWPRRDDRGALIAASLAIDGMLLGWHIV